MNEICMDCGEVLPLVVCCSAAGYYLGHWCSSHGPYDRCTEYMDETQAEATLAHVMASINMGKTRQTTIQA